MQDGEEQEATIDGAEKAEEKAADGAEESAGTAAGTAAGTTEVLEEAPVSTPVSSGTRGAARPWKLEVKHAVIHRGMHVAGMLILHFKEGAVMALSEGVGVEFGLLACIVVALLARAGRSSRKRWTCWCVEETDATVVFQVPFTSLRLREASQPAADVTDEDLAKAKAAAITAHTVLHLFVVLLSRMFHPFCVSCVSLVCCRANSRHCIVQPRSDPDKPKDNHPAPARVKRKQKSAKISQEVSSVAFFAANSLFVMFCFFGFVPLESCLFCLFCFCLVLFVRVVCFV